MDALPLSELRGLVTDLIGQVRALTDENRALRDEVARLKGLPPRPPTRPTPSGMEKASERAQAKSGQRRRGPVHERGVSTREVVLKAAVPAGSRFKCFEDVVVRDLVLEAVVIRYRRERWTGSGSPQPSCRNGRGAPAAWMRYCRSCTYAASRPATSKTRWPPCWVGMPRTSRRPSSPG